MARDRPSVSASRRRVLSSVAAAGVSPLLASAAADPADADSTAADSTATDLESPTAESTDADLLDALALGTFESGLDDWEAGDGVALSRVARSDRPVAVTEGEYALDVSADGASVPTISRPVGSLDLLAYPYFVADVAPGRVEETDAAVAFQFRLYRSSDLLDPDPDPAAASDPVTVRQASPGRVFWDASDADSGLLDAISRLELAWYPADHDSSSADSFAYSGGVVVDDVRATASVDPVGRALLAATFRELQFDHGVYERTEVTAEGADWEEGDLVFADGATEAYRFEVLADDQFRFTLAGTDVKLGGGW